MPSFASSFASSHILTHQGTWTVQHGSGGATVLVKSLAWPGFVFYHAPNTGKYGCIYTGIGQRNSDLAFMMPN